MRTRRSWRNQDRLWKALGQEGQPKKSVVKHTRVRGVLTVEAVLALSQEHYDGKHPMSISGCGPCLDQWCKEREAR